MVRAYMPHSIFASITSLRNLFDGSKPDRDTAKALSTSNERATLTVK